MGDRILTPDHEATGYYSKLKKPLSNPRQHKCPYNIRECKVCFPKFQAKIEAPAEEKYKLNPPDWVQNNINIFLILTHFYPDAALDPIQQKRAVRDFELIDVRWCRHMPAAESPVFEMTEVSIRKRLSRIREEAAKHLIVEDFAARWGICVAPPPTLRVFPDGDPATFDFDRYIRKFVIPFHLHRTCSK